MEKIYEILSEIRPEFSFKDSNDYIEDGLLDSFDMVALVTELESNFDCLIDALDIVPENFATAESIAETVKKNGGNI